MKKIMMLIALAALLLSLAACTQDAAGEPEGQTSAPESTQEQKEAWKIEFERSLMENYGVAPEYYEDLGDGVYQVYVKIQGKTVPYVAVNSATGDYHG